jgi:hypothetical protein
MVLVVVVLVEAVSFLARLGLPQQITIYLLEPSGRPVRWARKRKLLPPSASSIKRTAIVDCAGYLWYTVLVLSAWKYPEMNSCTSQRGIDIPQAPPSAGLFLCDRDGISHSSIFANIFVGGRLPVADGSEWRDMGRRHDSQLNF